MSFYSAMMLVWLPIPMYAMLPYNQDDFGMKYAAIGDWGPTDNSNRNSAVQSLTGDAANRARHAQEHIADQLNAWADAEHPIDFVLSHGDHFYWSGVAADNPGRVGRWEHQFEEMYNSEHLYVPWYGVMGNHDYGGASGVCGQNCWNCGRLCHDEEELITAMHNRFQNRSNHDSGPNRNHRWRMDGHYYKVSHTYSHPTDSSKSFSVDIFNLDTNACGQRLPDTCCMCYASDSNAHGNCENPGRGDPQKCQNGNTDLYDACSNLLQTWWDESMSGLEADLASSTATWKIVHQHYLMKFFTPAQQDQIIDILRTGGAHIFFGGHEHAEGHGSRCATDRCSHADGIHYIENGGGGGARVRSGTGNIWNQGTWGFMTGKISRNYFQVRFVDDNGAELHCYNIPNDRADRLLPESDVRSPTHPYLCSMMNEGEGTTPTDPPTPSAPIDPPTPSAPIDPPTPSAPIDPPTPSTVPIDPDQQLCDSSGVSTYRPEDIAVCENTMTECVVYEKLNHVIGQTCREYCSHFGLHCLNGWKDRSNYNCVPGDQIGCDSTDGNTSDHICHCGLASGFLTSKLRTLPNRQEARGGSLIPV